MVRRTGKFDVRKPYRVAQTRKFKKEYEQNLSDKNYYHIGWYKIDGFWVEVSTIYWETNIGYEDFTCFEIIVDKICYSAFLGFSRPSYPTILKCTRFLVKTIQPLTHDHKANE